LYAHIAEGKLAIHKDGGRTFITALELARYIQALADSKVPLPPCSLSWTKVVGSA
jgi:hypothetical protein